MQYGEVAPVSITSPGVTAGHFNKIGEMGVAKRIATEAITNPLLAGEGPEMAAMRKLRRAWQNTKPRKKGETMAGKYVETLDWLQDSSPPRPSKLTAQVSSRLLDTGDAEAAAVVDGLVSALRRIADLLETHGGHSEPRADDAYRIAMRLTIAD